ncbi:hypothetical protein DFH09DRAFT_442652 [Mycena vulgaris]|nr:hypothetical protein DFH09DRAFT_442652 [Mycena vulgaris]
MRVGRAFSSSARQASQPFFPETYKEKVSGTDKTFLKHRKRLAYKLNPFIPKEASVIHNVFRCSYLGLQGVRNEFASRVAAALAPLHEHPQAFRVKNTSFDRLLGPPTISFASELSLIDLHNPLGISPDTPKSEIPRIYDPSLVAQALSKAGFTGSFYAVDRLKPMTPGASYGVNRPWPDYKHRPLGGFVYPPRLHLDGGQKLGCVTLTLPGPTVMPLFNLFRMFADKNRHFKRIMELVTIWARSHDLHLNTQTIALMVVATMQTEVRPISQWGEKRGWANVDHVSDGRWHQAIHPVDVDFATKELLALPACSIETDILSFFRHWLDLGPSSMDAAFTVRHGRADQHIPRPYIHTWPQLSDFECSLSEIEDPAENFNRWHYSRLVIQDPFLTTHNHAEELPDSEVIRLVHQIKRTNDRLYAGRPLVSMFGPHAAPPGSPAETTILGNTVAYSAALPLLQKQSIPEDLVYEHDTAPIDLRRTSSRLTSRRRPEFDPSSRRRPEFEPRFESGSPDFRRRFHTTGTVSLAKKLKPPVSPKPHSPTEGKKLNPPVSPKSRFPAGEKKLNLHIPRFPTAREPERDEEGWGLNPVPVHEPSVG